MSDDALPETEDEWREKLTPEQYRVLREGGTEPKFSGDLLEVDEDGVFRCAGCGQELFSTDEKFESGTGWPSFRDVLEEDNVELRPDTRRSQENPAKEVVCSNCGGHLGHVFEDGPEPTGKRYCINSAALEFEESDQR